MTLVKICGLTCPEDIEMINELKPDFAGFVFAKSRRQVTVEAAAGLCGMLDKCIKKAGVFVNETKENIEHIIAACGLDIVQLHGDEPTDACHFNGCTVWKAFRIKYDTDFNAMQAYKTDAFLLDAYSKDARGGSGRTFDWTMAQLLNIQKPVVLAGGLTPENVREATDILHPYAVDASSGVETEGKKDYGKIKRFIMEVRQKDGKK